ncbi:MAG: division/cell wall cluster transcriptional repressor MraZ [Chitinophagaceae bacterium]|nr:division/cell wall cluster transcriptional repressor MraZ [Chitinophagaceae bacterium]
MSDCLGEYEITFDGKGRFMIPAAYLRQVNNEKVSFVLSRGFENCLTLYTQEQWTEVTKKLSVLNDFDPEDRKFKRIFLNGATRLEKDAAGRLLVSKPMLEHAFITKDAIFSAQSDKVEIWDKANYKGELEITPTDYSALAKRVLGGKKNNPSEG